MFENLVLVLVAVGLVVLNAFFVAAEFAIVKLRSTRVEELKQLHGWRGGILSAIHRKLDAYLSACQLGITLASLGLGWIGEPAFASLLEKPAEWLGLDDDPERVEAFAFVFAFTLISFLHIVAGEQAPKSLAIRRPEAVSLWTAVPLWLFYWVMYPFIWGLNASATGILRWAGLGETDDHAHEAPYSREELRAILHLSRPAAQGDERRISSMVERALELPDLEASDLMRPMRELVTIPAGASYEDVRRLVRQYRFSRYPVLDGNGEVRGVLHIKDLYLEEAGPDYAERLLRWLHQPPRIRGGLAVSKLLRLFQQGGSHMALVLDVDEGRPFGFLTFEDVMEAIFGQITDEHESLRKQELRRDPHWESSSALVARGDTPLFRIERELGRPIEGSDEIGTLAGIVMRQLDRVPQTGDTTVHDGLTLEVLKAKGPRADWIKVTSANPEVALKPAG